METDEAVEALEVHEEVEGLVPAGEEAVGVMRMPKMGKIQEDLTAKGVGAALPS